MNPIDNGDDLPDLSHKAVTKPKKPAPPLTQTNKTSLSQAELEDVLRQAGWDEKHIPTMSAIGMGESARDKQGRAIISSYNPGVGKGGKPTVEQSIGLWQINMHPSLNRPYDRNKLKSDPLYNAKVAKEIFQQQGFKAWGAYTDGNYKKFFNGKALPNSAYSQDGLPDLSNKAIVNPNQKIGLPIEAQVPADYDPAKLWPVGTNKPKGPMDNEGVVEKIDPTQTLKPQIPGFLPGVMEKPSQPITDPVQAKLSVEYDAWREQQKLPDAPESVAAFNQNLKETARAALAKQGVTNQAIQNVAISQIVGLVPQPKEELITKGAVSYTQDVPTPGGEDITGGASNIRETPDSFSRIIDFSRVPKGESKKEYLIQQLIPELASTLNLEAIDIENQLRENFQHETGPEPEKADSYKFTVTPEFVEQVQNRRIAKTEMLKRAIASGDDISPDFSSKYGINPQEIEDATSGKDTQYHEEVRQGRSNREKYEKQLARYQNTLNPDEPSTTAEIRAKRDMGWISDSDAEKAIKEEVDLHNRIIKEYTEGFGKYGAYSGAPGAENTQAELKKQGQERIKSILKDYPTLKAYEKAENEQKSGGLVGLIDESVKTGGRYVFKLPATAMELMAASADMVSYAPEVISGRKDSKEFVDGLMNVAKDWRDAVENKPEWKQKEGYKHNFIANELSEAISQFAVQFVLAPMTGGASILLPLAEGGTAQYREAREKGASRETQMGAALLGAALGVPDVLLKAKFLKGLGVPFIEKLYETTFGKLSKYFPKAQAKELTKVTVGSFIASGVKNSTLGFVGEAGQEYVEDVGNKLFAKATYNPKVTWQEALIPDEKALRGYAAAGFAGMLGGTVETAIEQLDQVELKKAEKHFEELMAQERDKDYYEGLPARQRERFLQNVANAKKLLPLVKKQIDHNKEVGEYKFGSQLEGASTNTYSPTKTQLKKGLKDQLAISPEYKGQLELNRQQLDKFRETLQPGDVVNSPKGEARIVSITDKNYVVEYNPKVNKKGETVYQSTVRMRKDAITPAPYNKIQESQELPDLSSKAISKPFALVADPPTEVETPQEPKVEPTDAVKPALEVRPKITTERASPPPVVRGAARPPAVKTAAPPLQVTTPKTIHVEAKKLNIDVNSKAFHALSKDLVGVAKLDSMDAKQLTKINNAIKSGLFDKTKVEEKKETKFNEGQQVITGSNQYATVDRVDPDGKHIWLEDEDGEVSKHLIKTIKTEQTLLKAAIDEKLRTDPQLQKFTHHSSVKNYDGSPRLLAHGSTLFKGDKFDPKESNDFGFHLGDFEQANDRVSYFDKESRRKTQHGAHIMPVVANIKKPLRLRDMGHWHAKSVLAQLLEQGITTKKESNKLLEEVQFNNKKGEEKIKQFLESKGYDGIVYKNEYEGESHKDSYIAFRPEQIKSVFAKDFDPSSQSLLKAAADKAKALGASGTAEQWINRNEGTIQNWNKYLKASRQGEIVLTQGGAYQGGLALLSKDVEKIFDDKHTKKAWDEALQVDLAEYLKEDARRAAVAQNPEAERVVYQYNSDPEGATKQIETLIKKWRDEALTEWYNYIDKENQIYAKDPFFKDWVWTDLIKLRNTRPDLPMGLDKAALAKVYDDVKKNPNSSSFQKLYEKAVKDIMLLDAETNEILKVPDGTWIKIPQTPRDAPEFKENVSKVQAVSRKEWCTSQGMAEAYLPMGAFWVLIKHNKSELAIRFHGAAVAEIQGKENNGSIPEEFLPDVKDLVRAKNEDGSPKVELTISSMDQILRSIRESKFKAKLADFAAEYKSLKEEIYKKYKLADDISDFSFVPTPENINYNNVSTIVANIKGYDKNNRFSDIEKEEKEYGEKVERLFLKHFDPEYTEKKEKKGEDDFNLLTASAEYILAEAPELGNKSEKEIFNEFVVNQKKGSYALQGKNEKELKELAKEIKRQVNKKQEELDKELDDKPKTTEELVKERSDKIEKLLDPYTNGKSMAFTFRRHPENWVPQDVNYRGKTFQEAADKALRYMGKTAFNNVDYLYVRFKQEDNSLKSNKEVQKALLPLFKDWKTKIFEAKKAELDKELAPDIPEDWKKPIDTHLSRLELGDYGISEIETAGQLASEITYDLVTENRIPGNNYDKILGEILSKPEPLAKAWDYYQSELAKLKETKKAELDKELDTELDKKLNTPVDKAYDWIVENALFNPESDALELYEEHQDDETNHFHTKNPKYKKNLEGFVKSLIKDELGEDIRGHYDRKLFYNEIEDLSEFHEKYPYSEIDRNLTTKEREEVVNRLVDNFGSLLKELKSKRKAELDKELNTPVDKVYDQFINEKLRPEDLEWYYEMTHDESPDNQFDEYEYVEDLLDSAHRRSLTGNHTPEDFASLYEGLSQPELDSLYKKINNVFPSLAEEVFKKKKAELDQELEVISLSLQDYNKIKNEILEPFEKDVREEIEEIDRVEFDFNATGYGGGGFPTFEQLLDLENWTPAQFEQAKNKDIIEILEGTGNITLTSLNILRNEIKIKGFITSLDVWKAFSISDAIENSSSERAEKAKIKLIEEYSKTQEAKNKYGDTLKISGKEFHSQLEQKQIELNNELLKSAADAHYNAIRLQNADFNKEFISKIESHFDENGNLFVSSEGIELFRRAVESDKQKRNPDHNEGAFVAVMLRKDQLTFIYNKIGELIKTKPDSITAKDLKPLKTLASNLKQAIANKSAIVYADADLTSEISEENLHEIRYRFSGHKENISEYYNDFNALYNAQEKEIQKAYENYFGRVYFNNQKYTNLSRGAREVLYEELISQIWNGDFDKLGLSDKEVAQVIDRDTKAYIEKNGKDVLNEIEKWVSKERSKQILEFKKSSNRTKANESKSTGSASNTKSATGNKGGKGSSQETLPSQDSPELGSPKHPKISGLGLDELVNKERKYPHNAERHTQTEWEELQFDAKYYPPQGREGVHREAEAWLQERGISNAVQELYNLPVNAHTVAKRQAVLTYLDNQVSEYYQQGNLGRAREVYDQMLGVINTISPEYTEWGQAISQLAYWSHLDPDAVVSVVETRRTRKGKGPLPLETHEKLRKEAKDLKTLDNEIEALDRELDSDNTDSWQKVLESALKTKDAALDALRKTFGRTNNKDLLKAIESWHGSVHVFDRIDETKTGSANGLALGWGFYSTNVKNFADTFRDEFHSWRGENLPGATYKLEIQGDKEHFLDWGKPFGKQSSYVQNIVKQWVKEAKANAEKLKKEYNSAPDKSNKKDYYAQLSIKANRELKALDHFINSKEDTMGALGGQLYRTLPGTDRENSKTLRSKGILGNKITQHYKELSRDTFVNFDADDVKIIELLKAGVDRREISTLDSYTREKLIEVGVAQYAEAKGLPLADWKSKVINHLEENHVDPTGAGPYLDSAYVEVRRLAREKYQEKELERIKKKYDIKEDDKAAEKLAEEKAQRSAIISQEAKNLREAKPQKDKRTLLEKALDNEVLGEDNPTEAKANILLAKDRNAYYKKFSSMNPQKLTRQYISDVEKYLSVQGSLKTQREYKQSVKEFAPNKGPLTPDQVTKLQAQLKEKRREKLLRTRGFTDTVKNYIERPETAWKKGTDWYLRMNRMGETGLTTALSTVSHNILAQRGVKLLNALENTIELVFSKAETKLGKEIFSKSDLDIHDKAKFSDIFMEEFKGVTLPGLRAVASEKGKEVATFAGLAAVIAYKEQVVQGILAHNPDLYELMMGKFSFGEEHFRDARDPDKSKMENFKSYFTNDLDNLKSKPAKVVEGAVRAVEGAMHYATALNRLQEKHFKLGTFLMVLAVDLKAQGVDVEAVFNGKIDSLTRKQLERAVKQATEVTFSGDIDVKLINQLSNAARWIPFGLNPMLFRRFLWNSSKFLLQHSPLMLAKAAGPLIGKQGLSKRDVSKVMSGIILYTLAVQLLKAFGSDDDDPTVLNIPGVGPIRVAAYNPVSTFLILANIKHRHDKGKRPLKNSSDLLMLIGRDTRYPNLGMEWFEALVDLGGTERDKVTKFGEKTQMVAGRSAAAYIQALSTLKAINQAFDGEEATIRDYIDEPFVGELKKKIPFSEKLTKLITGSNSLLKEDALTGMPSKAENTIFNQLGLTIIPKNQTGPKFSPVEEYLDNELRLKREKDLKFYKTPEERRSAAIAGQLYSAIDKGVDVSKRVEDYSLRGVLSKNQSTAILDANKATSSMERKAIESTISDLVSSYDYATDSEKEIIQQVLIKKARSQFKNNSLSDEEMRALKEIFPELR